MIKKICFSCYSNRFPGKPIRKVTLGRQAFCVRSQLIGLSKRFLWKQRTFQKGECNDKCSKAFQ